MSLSGSVVMARREPGAKPRLEPVAGDAEEWDAVVVAVESGDAGARGGGLCRRNSWREFLGAVGWGWFLLHVRVRQQGSCAASVSGQAKAAAKPGMTAESSSAWTLAMPSSSFARTPLMVVCSCSALYSSMAT